MVRTQPLPLSQPVGVRPAPGPGQDMTPTLLRERWASSRRMSVVDFYGHGSNMGDWACFSNFYDQTSCPFDFVLPREFGVGLSDAQRTTRCTCSEKAIMLCKAAIMGDSRSYAAIRGASSPPQAKALGRGVQGFNDDLWHAVVCSVAFEVVFQKFSKTPTLQPLLLATGEKLMCEATSNDRYWGIGINRGDQRCQNPSQWRGANILGWALMEVRSALRAGVPASEQAPKLPQQPSSMLDQHEKAFLKSCKVVREIWKLENLKSSGEKLNVMQEQKLNKKEDTLKDVRDTLENLAEDSALRQKNEDVMQAAIAELDVPKQSPIVVETQAEPQVAVGDGEKDLPSEVTGENNADGQKCGKSRGKRGGVSHAIRKYRADHAGA